MSVDQNTTETLARFAAGLDPSDLPASARGHARSLLLDGVACALAADYGDEIGVYAAFARAAGGPGESTVIGSDERLSLLGATLLNGYAVTAATVCDTYVPAHVHITPEVLPPALAVAERDGADGRSLLAAVAIGAEVAVRVANGINYAVAGKRGWHMPGIVGPFGAAAAVGRLTGLDAPRMRNAFGLAGSQSAGTWASWGTPTVKFHQSRGAASGLLAALLAARDFTASADILTHPDGGILAAYSDGGRPEAILEGLGERFVFEDIALRLWPGGTPLQPTLTAVFDLIASGSLRAEDIRSVTVEVAEDVHRQHARFDRPKGTFEALLSFQFAVASALRDRRFWLTSTGERAMADPGLARLMERIALVASPDLDRERSRVAVEMADGRVLSAVAAAKGTRANPLTGEDLGSKLALCAAGRLEDGEVAELRDILLGIEEVKSLDRMFALLRAARPRAGR